MGCEVCKDEEIVAGLMTSVMRPPFYCPNCCGKVEYFYDANTGVYMPSIAATMTVK